MSTHLERGLGSDHGKEFKKNHAGTVLLTFKTNIDGPVSMPSALEGCFVMPSFDQETCALTLPYGSSADLRFQGEEDFQLDVAFRYDKRRHGDAPNIHVITRFPKDNATDNLVRSKIIETQRLTVIHADLSPFKANTVSFNRLYIFCTPIGV